MEASLPLQRITLFLIAVVVPACAQQYTISTVAGGVQLETQGVAITSGVGPKQGLVVDSSGSVYFGSVFDCVFKVDVGGNLTRHAGTCRPGFSGDNAPATSAQVSAPSGFAVYGGSLYIADRDNNRIRRVSADGTITTIAGNGIAGYGGDNGDAISAHLNGPTSIAFDSSGDLYIADTNNHVIREVFPTGSITTFAGTGTPGFSGDAGAATSAQLNLPTSISVGPSGALYIADTGNNRIRQVTGGVISTLAGNGAAGYSGDGGVATAAELSLPGGVSVDSENNIYIADTGNHRVRKVSAGVITSIAGTGIVGNSGDGEAATRARLSSPASIATDSSNNIYILDSNNKSIRTISNLTGTISTFVGSADVHSPLKHRPSTSALLALPSGLAADSSGNLYIADTANNRIRMISNGVVSTVAGTGVAGYGGDGLTATTAQLNSPTGIAVDASGNLYIADSQNNRVRVVSGGVISTLAGNGTAGSSGDGGQATSAELSNPYAVAVHGGTVYISDSGNSRVRQVTGGIISNFAGNGTPGDRGDGGSAVTAELLYPAGLAVDTSGNVYIVDRSAQRIREVIGGVISTVAGTGIPGYTGDSGLATSAQLNNPSGVGIDTTGNLYIADTNNARIRKVGTNGVITTIAGNGTTGYTGDGGPATSAELYSPTGLAIMPEKIYVADPGNNTLRSLTTPVNATMTSPTPGSTLTGSSVTFQWTTGTGVSAYWLSVSKTGVGGFELYNGNQGAATSHTVTGLPTDGSTIYVRLYSNVGSAWPYLDYTYTGGSGSTLSAMTSPTPGSTLAGSSVTFQWTTGTGVSGYWLSVSKTGVGGFELYNGSQGTATSHTVTGLPTDGSTIYVRLYSNVGSAWPYVDYSYTAAAGTTLSAMTSPTPGSTLAGSSVTFQWTTGSGVSGYWLSVSKTGVGGFELYNGSQGTATSHTVTGLPTDGSMIYVRLYSNVGSAWPYVDYTYTAATGTTLSAMTSPVNHSTLAGSSVTFQWTTGSGVSGYWLSISKTGVGGFELYNGSQGTATSHTVTGLPTDGSTIYVRLYSNVGSTWPYVDYTYTASAAATLAAMTSPANHSTFASSSVTFQWTTGSGVSGYWLSVSKTSVGGFELYNGSQGTATSHTVTGLPTDGSTIYVRLYSNVGSTWPYVDYTYTALTTSSSTITLSSVTVGNQLQVPITITFNPTPVSDITLTITSLTPGSVLLGSSQDAGAAQLVATITAGTPSVSTYVKALASAGSATITAAASGYATGSGTVTLAPSGFVLSGPNGIGGAFTTFEGVPTTLTVYAARLDSSSLFVEPEQLIGGSSVNVPVSSAPTTIGTVSPTSIAFPGATNASTVQFTAGTSSGAASVTITQPTGFTIPAAGSSINVTVQSVGLIAPAVVIGQNLQTSTNVSISGNAPNDIPVTISSADTTKLQFACIVVNASCSQTNSGTIVVKIPQNQTQSADFYARGYASSGSASYSMSASNYGTVQASITLVPSELLIQTPTGYNTDFNISIAGGLDATLNIYPAAVTNSGPLLEAVAADQSISAAVTSGTTSVGTISSSPVQITGGSSFGTTTFHPVGLGASTIVASATGYTSATVHANVQSATLSVNNGLTIGKFLEANGVVLLSAPAPSGGAQVTITSNSGLLKLAVNPTDAGASSITVTVAQGAQSTSFWVYSLGSTGTATYTATATGYGSSTDTVTLVPSAVLILGPSGCPGACSVSLSGGATSLTLITDNLSPDGTPDPYNELALAGNVSLNVVLNNSNTATGTVASSVNIAPATPNGTALTFTPVGTGSTTVSIATPTGWTSPGTYSGINLSQVVVTVH